MWQTFITAYQDALSSSNTLFSCLHRAGIKAIGSEHCQTLIHTLTLLEKTQKHGLFYLPFHVALRDAQKKATSQSLEKTLPLFKQVLQIGQAGQANYRYYQQLQADGFWVTQFDAVRQDRKVYQQMLLLHQQWMKESPYAAYSTQGLLWVYHTVLPVFQAWLNYAIQELALKQAKLGVQLATRYQHFLHQLNLELKTEKQRIRHTLYQRLVIGMDYYCLGVEYGLFAFIKKLTLLRGNSMDERENLSAKAEKSAVVPISSKSFQKTTETLQDAAPGEIKPLPTLLNSTGLCEPPFYLNFPQWLQHWFYSLFWGDYVRYTFFQHPDYQAMLAKEKAFAPFANWEWSTEIPIEQLASDPHWGGFIHLLQELEKEKLRCLNAMKKLSSFFHAANYQMFEQYDKTLYGLAHAVLNQQVAQLKRYLTECATIKSFTHQEQLAWLLLLDSVEDQHRDWETEFRFDFTELRAMVIDAGDLPQQNQPSPILGYSFAKVPNYIPIFTRFQQAILDLIESYENDLKKSFDEIPQSYADEIAGLKILLTQQTKQLKPNVLTLHAAIEAYHRQLTFPLLDVCKAWLTGHTIPTLKERIAKLFILRFKAYKFYCTPCQRYFRQRFPGIGKHQRATERLHQHVFYQHTKGVSQKSLALDFKMGKATVERWYHQQYLVTHKETAIPHCPTVLGIDEHFFSKKQGYATTFCNLKKHKIFDIVKGRSEKDLAAYLQQLPGKERVKIVCIDLSSSYRQLVQRHFPNAQIVADRFHVIRLMLHQCMQTYQDIDPSIKYQRGLIAALRTNPDNLTPHRLKKRDEYLAKQPAIQAIYQFKRQLHQLLMKKTLKARQCKKFIPLFLNTVALLKNSSFKRLATLGKTLYLWRNEIVRMWRFRKNNGITEGFHRKMKLIQRRAYGFKNFENYRLRVKVLCS